MTQGLQGGGSPFNETPLQHASAGQWRALDELLATLLAAQRLSVLNEVLNSRLGGVEPTLEEIVALTNLVCGRPIRVESRLQRW